MPRSPKSPRNPAAAVLWDQAVDDTNDTAQRVLLLEACLRLEDDFAYGWSLLGRLQRELGRTDEAINSLEYSYALTSGSMTRLDMACLVALLETRAAPGDDDRRLAVLLDMDLMSEQVPAALFKSYLFSLGYLLMVQKRFAEAGPVFERLAQDDECLTAAVLFNLSLCYQHMRRDADALDVVDATWSPAKHVQSDAQREEQRRQECATQLALIASRARQSGPMELPQDDWYKHYIAPYHLLNDAALDADFTPRELQKAKQALLREIELEDGRVQWMPGLVLDRSSALACVAQIETPEGADLHAELNQVPELSAFLMRGSVEYFVRTPLRDGKPSRPFFTIADEMIAFISPIFAAQFDRMLTLAASKKAIDVVAAMFTGRRLVVAADEEVCFAGFTRLLDRLIEPLAELAVRSNDQRVSKKEVDRVYVDSGLSALLGVAPAAFNKAKAQVGALLRSISVDIYNRDEDKASAAALLDMASAHAGASAELANRIQEDRKTLADVAAAERKRETHLTIGSADLVITRAGVTYGPRTLEASDISGLRWVLEQTSASPPAYRFLMAFTPISRGVEMAVTWQTKVNAEKNRELFSEAMGSVYSFIIPSIHAHLMERLENYGYFNVGPVKVKQEGLVLTKRGLIFDSDVLVPWGWVDSHVGGGMVTLRDQRDAKVTNQLSCESVVNAFVLHLMIQLRKES